jgi:hypothetical protein
VSPTRRYEQRYAKIPTAAAAAAATAQLVSMLLLLLLVNFLIITKFPSSCI